jgi:hypothetical protein
MKMPPCTAKKPTIIGRLAATVLPLTIIVPSRAGGMSAMCASVQTKRMTVSPQYSSRSWNASQPHA